MPSWFNPLPRKPPPPPTVMERFSSIIAVAIRAVGVAPLQGLPGPVSLLIIAYLKRLEKRFLRLVEMARTGTLKPPRQRPKPAEGAERPTRKRERPPLRMWGYGWIAYRARGALVAGTRLQALLEDAGMIELVGLDPRFSAILRPLCAALCTTPNPGRLLPPPPRPPREPKPKPPKPPRKPRAKKLRWRCAKPPQRGLIFNDDSYNY